MRRTCVYCHSQHENGTNGSNWFSISVEIFEYFASYIREAMRSPLAWRYTLSLFMLSNFMLCNKLKRWHTHARIRCRTACRLDPTARQNPPKKTAGTRHEEPDPNLDQATRLRRRRRVNLLTARARVCVRARGNESSQPHISHKAPTRTPARANIIAIISGM